MRAPGLLSAPVLLGAVLLSSPALWRALVEGTGSTTVALTRFLVCVVVCWLALSVLTALVGPPPRRGDGPDAGLPDPGEDSPAGD